MIEKVVTRRGLKDGSSIRDDLAYWLSKSPEERLAAVEYLRWQQHGNAGGLQIIARVIKLPKR